MEENERKKPFSSSPVKDAYFQLVTLTKCRKCGVDHGMGILDTVTHVHTPIDLCYDCLWSNAFTYHPPTQQVVIEENADWGEMLRKAQDRIIRNMIISSASPSLTDLTSNQDKTGH